MSVVRNVSDITRILSGIIKNEPTLQNVWVQGEVLVEGPQNTFSLMDEEKKLRCFIPSGNRAQFGPLLATGEKVAVNGRIALFPRFSEYQIHLVDAQPGETNITENNQLFTVSDVTNKLKKITANFSGFQQIQVCGEISHFESPSNQPWYLSDPSEGGQVTNQNQKIHCFTNPDLVNSTDLMKDGGGVRIQGAIRIWETFSRYQIYVEQIEPDVGSDNRNAQCQCPGCESCQSQGGTCSSLQDQEYELCPDCYHESPDREDRVVQAVYAYFDALKGNGFFPEKKRTIQMGSDNREADVVLVDANGSFAAISECKGAGYVGYGIDQLNSYLSATDAHFGIFSNRANPEQWEFYKNLGRNQFESITSDQFTAGIKELTDLTLQSAFNRIHTLECKNEQLEQIQRGLKEQLNKVKHFLQPVMQIVDSASEEIDE